MRLEVWSLDANVRSPTAAPIRRPTDAPLSFDARQPVRGSRPLPMTLIISAVVLATLVVAVLLIYRGGVRGLDEPPRTVRRARRRR